MDKAKFGKIVKSLRSEHINYANGGILTQQHLAKAAMLSEAVIGKIERGERTKLEGDEITSLADALLLSTLERRAFFSAATEVHEGERTAKILQPDRVVDHFWRILSSTKLPAFLVDPLFNMIGINRIMMNFHGLTDQMLDNASKTKVGVNILDIMFREPATLRQSMGKQWDVIARANLYQFRYMALRYRYMEQFDTLLSHMHMQPNFSQLWTETRTYPNRDFFSQLRYYDYTHAIHGPVCYAATLSTIVTNYGDLYLTTHMPCNDETLAKFAEIGQKSHGARKVMPWPSLMNDK